MSENCQLVVFSNKAYNAIIRESFDKDPIETGGILLGHVLDNGVWIVMEVLPPGINSIFQYAYFEYDEAFVNYLAQSVANQYKRPLDLLGLWHRHPGGMDVFSTTDDETNTTFACQNPAGVISGLVNIDPNFRLTMYHLDRPTGRLMGRPNYSVVDVEVGDDIIPEEYFELRYFSGVASNLHPTVASREIGRSISRTLNTGRSGKKRKGNGQEGVLDEEDTNSLDIQRAINQGLPIDDASGNATPKVVNDFFSFWRASKRKWILVLGVILVLIICIFTFKSCKDNFESVSSWISELFHKDEKDEPQKDETKDKTPSLSLESINLTVDGNPASIKVDNLSQDAKVKWKSSNDSVVSVQNGIITPVGVGEATVSAFIKNKCIGNCNVKVEGTTDVESSVSLTSDSGSVSTNHSFAMPPHLNIEGNPEISYSSSDTIIATVSPTGVVSAKKHGTAFIIIDWPGGEPLKYKVTVK